MQNKVLFEKFESSTLSLKFYDRIKGGWTSTESNGNCDIEVSGTVYETCEEDCCPPSS